jgi:hypothetical protein
MNKSFLYFLNLKFKYELRIKIKKMEICHRCKKEVAEYNCDICRSLYCEQCDLYIHSLTSKQKHSRKKLNELTRTLSPKKNNDDENKLSLSPQQLSLSETLDETDSSLKKNKSFSSLKALNNLNYFEEKIKLLKQISQLNIELSNTRNNIDQKLDIINDHLHKFNNENKNKIIELNYKNIKEINLISSQKITLIDHLKNVMNDQEETIQKLLKKKNKLEEEINANKYLIEKYTTEKNNLIKEKENNKIAYNEKKNLLEKTHNFELQNLKNDYNNELERLLSIYNQSKLEYLNEIKKGNDMIENYKSKGKKEIELINDQIENLQKENNIKSKEKEDIICNNKKLEQSLTNLNEIYDETYRKYKINKDTRKKIKKNFNEAQKEVKTRKKENTKLHDLKYGRF